MGSTSMLTRVAFALLLGLISTPPAFAADGDEITSQRRQGSRSYLLCDGKTSGDEGNFCGGVCLTTVSKGAVFSVENTDNCTTVSVEIYQQSASEGSPIFDPNSATIVEHKIGDPLGIAANESSALSVPDGHGTMACLGAKVVTATGCSPGLDVRVEVFSQ